MRCCAGSLYAQAKAKAAQLQKWQPSVAPSTSTTTATVPSATIGEQSSGQGVVRKIASKRNVGGGRFAATPEAAPPGPIQIPTAVSNDGRDSVHGKHAAVWRNMSVRPQDTVSPPKKSPLRGNPAPPPKINIMAEIRSSAEQTAKTAPAWQVKPEARRAAPPAPGSVHFGKPPTQSDSAHKSAKQIALDRKRQKKAEAEAEASVPLPIFWLAHASA